MLAPKIAEGNESKMKQGKVSTFAEIIILQIRVDALGSHCLGQRFKCQFLWSFDIPDSSISLVGSVVEGAADPEAELVDDFHLMQSAIDTCALLLFVPHALHSRDADCLAILVGVPEALGDPHYSLFGNGDIFEDDLHSLLSIPVQNLKVLAKIIEHLPVGSIAVGREEGDLATPAELVQFQLLLMRKASGNHHFEPTH